jgi:hypothetical protein
MADSKVKCNTQDFMDSMEKYMPPQYPITLFIK